MLIWIGKQAGCSQQSLTAVGAWQSSLNQGTKPRVAQPSAWAGRTGPQLHTRSKSRGWRGSILPGWHEERLPWLNPDWTGFIITVTLCSWLRYRAGCFFYSYTIAFGSRSRKSRAVREEKPQRPQEGLCTQSLPVTNPQRSETVADNIESDFINSAQTFPLQTEVCVYACACVTSRISVHSYTYLLSTALRTDIFRQQPKFGGPLKNQSP